MKETIFYLEGRGGQYLYHFFIYNLGGLFYIENNIYNHRNNDSVRLNDATKVVEKPSSILNYPLKIYMKDVTTFQRQAFEIIKDKFTLIEELPNHDNYEIVSIYGETCIYNIPDNFIVLDYIRELFRDRIKYNVVKGKRIFITRKNSEQFHYGVLKRYMKNEKNVMNELKKYNFECIQLEDYDVEGKIKLFMESEVIVSTHSGALTFSLFCNKETTIIEILNKGTHGFPHQHYSNICNRLKLKFKRYLEIEEDSNGNFDLDFEKFDKFLINYL